MLLLDTHLRNFLIRVVGPGVGRRIRIVAGGALGRLRLRLSDQDGRILGRVKVDLS